ncbi:MAG: glycosyltransferase family 4 protein [Coriobacteriia bacterium]|nr:glycosyltransferase family 4 protein [Coriobacteriia bacterium]
MTTAVRRSILFVNNFPGPTLGGGEVHLMHLVRGAIAEDWQVSVATAKGSALAGDARAVGADVFELGYSRTRLPSKPGRLRDIAAAYDADVIVGTGFLTNMLVRRAAAGLEDTKVVNIVHTEPDASRHEGAGPLGLGMRRRVDAASRGRVDRFVAISSAVRNALCAGGVEPERVITIPNGIDIATVRSDAGLPAPEGLRVTGPLVGCVGRLAPVKGVEYFIRMAGSLGFQVPRARFVIAGSGPEDSRLREIAYAHNLGDRLVFLGHVSPVAPVLAACDVVVIPSLSEGFALVAAEAMALSRPVVGTSVGGLADVVVDGETGLLVPPADSEALAAAVARLLRNPALATRMGEAGAARAEEHFTLERMVRAHLDLYAELAAG